MTDWLLDTLLWTGVLLALVLVLRRPVARHFGPQAAYALWALPFLRLVTPAITLPAWMNPSPEAVGSASETYYVLTGAGAEPVVPVLAEPMANPPIDWLALGLAAWLTGAVVFLIVRFRAYFEMRRELLADAREVGRLDGGVLGAVRLVETPATNAPLAFGVHDRVIALPPRFLAMAERPMRDLALAHELAHHKGADLIANFAVQPLFALHWFNPLGWVGWRAMRRDQEAACDARVVGTADAGIRATYAQTIASFAAGPRVALAAPMACPVLGDKSIIHRLRSLTMSDISTRRRWAGRSLLLAGALALPLTASISYAEAVQDAPEAPAPPAPPRAPEAPVPADAPDAPKVYAWSSDDDDFEIAFGDGEDGEKVVKRKVIVNRDGDDDDSNVFVFRTRDEDGKVRVEERRVHKFKFKTEDGKELDEKELEKMLEEKMKLHEKDFEKMGKRMELQFGEGSEFQEQMIHLGCDGTDGHKADVKTKSGNVAIAVCAEGMAKDAMKMVAKSLKSARVAIEKDSNLSAEERSEALQAIDEEIARIGREG
ncbi:M56 family metallopeptidase [Parerythrobacter aestuarii]|uniref:M56 family metallopeptidase n=1 Tax=Parerythrobacter aestuarii TaxID=3020909 RepID=UPI0024DEDFF3|nr:M56 family metallopeptidase [Parerythrobacter aestuarii]